MRSKINISFFAPFKPLDHPDPSGDWVIGNGVYHFIAQRGHGLWTASRARARWVYLKPWQWPYWLKEKRRIVRRLARRPVDLWMTYHSYYKAPDVLGPMVSRESKIPYVLFQGIYATKRRRSLRTLPGFLLNRRALTAATHVFTNKRGDHDNLKRIVPAHRLTYLPPGIYPEEFYFDESARAELRTRWQVGTDPVVLSAAMFRSDVKTKGLLWLIRTCGELYRGGRRFFLVIAGEGREKKRIQALAREQLPGRVIFLGKVPRNDMFRFYSAGDVFAFPGIRESLGMVYLEAQSCGLPIVAFENGGIPEVVRSGQTGFLVPMYSTSAFARAIEGLLSDNDLRRAMGQAAARYVRKHHDLNRNYRQMETVLLKIANKG